MALKNYESGKISLIDRIRHMTLPARIASISGAVLILAAAGTGVFLLTGQNRQTAPAVASQVSTAVSSKPAATALSLSQTSVSLNTGKTVQITATPEPASTNEKVVWTSSDEKVATVSPDGLVTAVSKGTCTVTASVGSTVSAAVQVTVKDPGDEEIALLKAYLKNGLQAPSPKSMQKLSHGMDGDGGEVTIKKLNDAAIVDLNGDGHYEMIVEDLFHMIAIRSDQYSYEPFYEIYYVKDGKVVRSPTVIGTENGDYMGSITCFLAQDSKTKKYYFVIDTVHGMGDSGVKYQASIINGKAITPVMNIEHGYYIDLDPKGYHADLNPDDYYLNPDGNEGSLCALNGKEVDEAGFEEASKRLVPIHFDLSRNHYGQGNLDDKEGTVQDKTFDMDQIKIYKNDSAPASSIDDIIKQAQARITADPTNLLGMSLNRIKKLYGSYHTVTLPSDAVYPYGGSKMTQLDNYPYMLGDYKDGNGGQTPFILITKNGTAFYKNLKVGMTFSQIKSIVPGIIIGDGEQGEAGKAFLDVSSAKGNIEYTITFDNDRDITQPTAKCLAVEIAYNHS